MGADRDESPPPSDKARKFGHNGIPVGAIYQTRRELMDKGVHGAIRKGIHGDKYEGAYSILLCGGYEDDEDWGDTIVYTGQGGRDARGRQVEDQRMDVAENRALVVSKHTGKPVRVIRGADKENIHAPLEGYRYDGLYRVDSICKRSGLKGYKMCMFDLSKIVEGPGATRS